MMLMIFLLIVGSLFLGGTMTFLVMRMFRATDRVRVETRMIAERVRAVGRLVGLEVHAKEIATARRALGWLSPLVVSEARVAMIFQFEKQYGVDLAGLDPASVERLGPRRYRLTLPAVRGMLRLVEVRPYDIQQGKFLGLLDVIPMTAERQGELMQQAQVQASELYAEHDARYRQQAREAIERQISALVHLLEVEVEVAWGPDAQREESSAPRPAALVEPGPSATVPVGAG